MLWFGSIFKHTPYALWKALLLISVSVEHLMALYSEIRRAAPCSTGGLDFLRTFYMLWFGAMFKFTPYALWKALLLQLSNFLSTFTWSYMDLFVTILSLALTAKFNQINQKLQGICDKVRGHVKLKIPLPREKLLKKIS